MPNDQPTANGSTQVPLHDLGKCRAQVVTFPCVSLELALAGPSVEVTPRKLNRSTPMPASAGRRQAALRIRWLSDDPP